MSQEYITFTIGGKKNIALIAHDNEKAKLNINRNWRSIIFTVPARQPA